MLKNIIIFIIIFVSFSLLCAEEITGLAQLTKECIDTAKKYKTIQNDLPYKSLHTVQYEGWSGDADNFQLVRSVKMTIKYSGASKTGYYWFLNNPQKKYDIIAKSDRSGNFEMVENIGGRIINYTFHGLMKDGVIQGLWEKGDGKKAFAFYVKAIDN